MAGTAAARLYTRLTGARTEGLDAAAQASVPRNGLRIIAASALQNAGDEAINAKTVLPWLLSAVGAPGWTVGLLVPIRESGSMLPQAAMTPWVRRRRARKWVWVAGGAWQAVAVAAMALVAATATGQAAGVGILLVLAAFSLGRALSSIASKDVLGRTIPQGQRGRINGTSTLVAGVVAVTVGLLVRVVGGDDPDLLLWLLVGAAAAWVAAVVIYAGVHEPVGDGGGSEQRSEGWVRRSRALLRDDTLFRRFVVVRALLLVSALSPPFVTALAASAGGSAFGALGPFLIASGLASLLGGRLAGRFADRSSRRLMAVSAALASGVVVVFLALLALPAARGTALLYPAVYLLLALTHVGVRVGRKTYVVDMAEGDRRTEYVAVSNTAMGFILLLTGAVSSGLATLGAEAALAFLATLGFVGVLLARRLPEVE